MKRGVLWLLALSTLAWVVSVHALRTSPTHELTAPASPLFERQLAEKLAQMEPGDGEAAPGATAQGPEAVQQQAILFVSEAFSACAASGCIGSACGASGCVGSGCAASGCGGSACGGSACGGSACGGSGCAGSACVGSACGGSGCAGSACVGSVCPGSACVGSACGGSVCVTSACGGSVCGGSACAGSVCGGSACGVSGCVGSMCSQSGCVGSLCGQSACAGSLCANCPGDSTASAGGYCPLAMGDAGRIVGLDAQSRADGVLIRWIATGLDASNYRLYRTGEDGSAPQLVSEGQTRPDRLIEVKDGAPQEGDGYLVEVRDPEGRRLSIAVASPAAG